MDDHRWKQTITEGLEQRLQVVTTLNIGFPISEILEDRVMASVMLNMKISVLQEALIIPFWALITI